MIIKKFVGKTEEEATANARQELGEAAVIMNVRPTKKKGFLGLFRKPQVEVTAAVEELSDSLVSNIRPVPPPPSIRPVQPKPKQSFPDVIEEEEKKETSEEEASDKEASESEKRSGENAIEQKLDSIHTMIEQQIKRENGKPEEEKSSEEEKKDREMTRFFELINETLVENEVDEKYAKELIEEAEKLKKPGVTLDYMLSNIYQKMILKFGETHLIEKSSDDVLAVFFLGPTGVGKTTTIAKIASRLSLQDKKRVAFITTDTYRVKAAEQLRTYADILNIPFRIVYHLDDMRSALNEFKNFDFVLMDTAGHSPKNKEQFNAQKEYIDVVKEYMKIEVYLVLSITTKYKDLLNIADTYSKMVDYRLIFTKLDETSTFGNMLNLELHTGASMSYVTNGQDVPDDIEVFNPQKTVRILLGGKTDEL